MSHRVSRKHRQPIGGCTFHVVSTHYVEAVSQRVSNTLREGGREIARDTGYQSGCLLMTPFVSIGNCVKMYKRGLREQEVMQATAKIIAPTENKIVTTPVAAVLPISVGRARGVLD